MTSSRTKPPRARRARCPSATSGWSSGIGSASRLRATAADQAAHALRWASGIPSKIADHRARQGLGQVGDDVHASGGRNAIEQRVDVSLDARPECLDGPRRERPAHRVAEPRVVRRIPEEHRLPGAPGLEARGVSESAAHPIRDGPAARPEVTLEPLAAEPWVAEDGRDVGVAGQDPEPI